MENKYTYLLIALVILIVTPLIVAQPVFKQNEATTLSIPCTIDDNYCSANAICLATIINPNGDVLINNNTMIINEAVAEINLTANQTEVNGEYEFTLVCTDAGETNDKTLTFWITPNGEIPSTAKGIIYIGLFFIFVLFLILSIVWGGKVEHIAMKWGLYLLAYLLFIGITFIAWNLSIDYLTSTPFIISFFRILWLVSMIAFFPLIIISFIYMLWMIRKIDVIENMLEKGMPIDEAYERQVKSGLSRSRQW